MIYRSLDSIIDTGSGFVCFLIHFHRCLLWALSIIERSARESLAREHDVCSRSN